jgi:zinc transporter ZupT
MPTSNGKSKSKSNRLSMNDRPVFDKSILTRTLSDEERSIPMTPRLLRIKGGVVVPPSSFLSSLPLYAVKALAQLFLTSVNILCFAIPLFNESVSGNKQFLSLANAFAGGIFLMLAFGHMLPHSIHILESIGKDRNIAFYATLVGYLLVFFIEKVAFASAHAEGDKDVEGGGSAKSAIVLLFAMAVHSLMETAALGLATDARSTVLMATSIGLHQPAESLALLVAFLKTPLSRSVIIKWLGLFSCIGPIGVSLGILISKIATPFAEAVIVGLTAGTFIFVGATEVCSP